MAATQEAILCYHNNRIDCTIDLEMKYVRISSCLIAILLHSIDLASIVLLASYTPTFGPPLAELGHKVCKLQLQVKWNSLFNSLPNNDKFQFNFVLSLRFQLNFIISNGTGCHLILINGPERSYAKEEPLPECRTVRRMDLLVGIRREIAIECNKLKSFRPS